MIAAGRGRAIAFALAPGPAHKLPVAPVACPPWIYANRHLVENLWAHLKEWRAGATRYEKTPHAPFSACSAGPLPPIGSSSNRP